MVRESASTWTRRIALIFDLWVDRTASDLETEVERLLALGAKRVEWTYPEDADFVVLADTEGNLFCVIA